MSLRRYATSSRQQSAQLNRGRTPLEQSVGIISQESASGKVELNKRPFEKISKNGTEVLYKTYGSIPSQKTPLGFATFDSTELLKSSPKIPLGFRPANSPPEIPQPLLTTQKFPFGFQGSNETDGSL